MTPQSPAQSSETAESQSTDAPQAPPAELQPLPSAALAERIAGLAWERKATDVVVMRVLELVEYTDWFVVCSGRSNRQVSAISDSIVDGVREQTGEKPYSIEGNEHNQWVLVDYGDVVVHIFFEPVRDYYQLGKLWSEAPLMELTPPEGLDTGHDHLDDDDDDDEAADAALTGVPLHADPYAD